MEKPKEENYNFTRKYKIVKTAEWKPIEIPKDVFGEREPVVAWQMTAAHPSGYGYEYRKCVAIHRERAELLIDHRLINTGKKAIATEVYNHNFFNVDGDPVGPNYSFTFRVRT